MAQQVVAEVAYPIELVNAAELNQHFRIASNVTMLSFGRPSRKLDEDMHPIRQLAYLATPPKNSILSMKALNALCEALKYNTSLTVLDLSSTYF